MSGPLLWSSLLRRFAYDAKTDDWVPSREKISRWLGRCSAFGVRISRSNDGRVWLLQDTIVTTGVKETSIYITMTQQHLMTAFILGKSSTFSSQKLKLPSSTLRKWASSSYTNAGESCAYMTACGMKLMGLETTALKWTQALYGIDHENNDGKTLAIGSFGIPEC